MIKRKTKIGIIGAVVIGIITIFAFDNPDKRYFEITKNLDIFASLFKEVNAFYVDEINPNKLIRTGIDAMLASLDPYTNYIPEDDIEDYRTMTTGQYGGIGAVIGKKNDKIVIIMPYVGFPAYKAGLQVGDEIIKVDGVDVENKNTSEISELLKGQANTSLTVTIRRYGHKDPIDIAITREKITINNVPYSGLVRDHIGYIKLSEFTSGAGRSVKKAVEQLKKKGARKIVLDLRDNPGGLLNEAVNVANVFIPRGWEVVSTKGKVTDWNKVYKALNNPTDTKIEIAVLTNHRSASAAEIVSGVIQDYDRGILVGERTFGKGLVQATRSLPYNSKLKITTAKYYIPSGRCIQAINYSHRNKDGSVAKIPDSLRVAFKTKHGRVVYDGGGISPDIKVVPPLLTPISVSLITKGLIFDYAVKYHYEHPEIAPARDFKLTHDEYEDFVHWLSDKDYDYTTKVEKTIDDLKTVAKKEKYYDKIKENIDQLEAAVKHNKEKDLKEFESEIRALLEGRIAETYYLMKGSFESSFDDDVQLKAAIDVLNDPERFRELLNIKTN